MPTIKINLFGGGFVSVGDKNKLDLHSKCGELLIYLLIFRHQSHSREKLAHLFWEQMEERKARRCLSTALWRLKNQLALDENSNIPQLIICNENKVQFNLHHNCWVDIIEFEEKVVSNLDSSIDELQTEIIQQLETGGDLYKSSYLEGFYADWALRERERTREHYLKSLRRLMEYYAREKMRGAAIRCGIKILEQDPLREDIHREVIRLHIQNGHRTKAIRQYQKCKDILEKELNIPPMQETQALYYDLINFEQPHPLPQQKIKLIETALAHVGIAAEEVRKIKYYLQKSLVELNQDVKSQN